MAATSGISLNEIGQMLQQLLMYAEQDHAQDMTEGQPGPEQPGEPADPGMAQPAPAPAGPPMMGPGMGQKNPAALAALAQVIGKK